MVKKKVKCYYCGSTRLIEDEHIRAQSKGGVSTVPGCMACNRSKSDEAPAVWVDRLIKNDRSRWRRIRDYQKGRRTPFAIMVRRRRSL